VLVDVFAQVGITRNCDRSEPGCSDFTDQTRPPVTHGHLGLGKKRVELFSAEEGVTECDGGRHRAAVLDDDIDVRSRGGQ
jgi:hypothetical protein